MFGSLGLPELIAIFVVALLLFGPRKLPEIGRTLGKALGEFKRASNDLKRSLEEEVATEDLKQLRGEIRGIGSDIRDIGASVARDDAAPPVTPSPSEPPAAPPVPPVEPK